jgi:hypothetical protein
VYNHVRVQFSQMTTVKHSWAMYLRISAPASDHVDDYVTEHPLHVLFGDVLFSSTYHIPTDTLFFCFVLPALFYVQLRENMSIPLRREHYQSRAIAVVIPGEGHWTAACIYRREGSAIRLRLDLPTPIC